MNNKRVWRLAYKCTRAAARGGFTLIELLIVMVVVGILVTVALPKYKAALEKGRGLEGVANASAVSEAVNAYYVKNDNSYSGDVADFAEVAGITQTKNFNAPTISLNGGVVTVRLARNTGSYTIVFANSGGEVTSRSCEGNLRYCKALGASQSCNTTTCYF